MPKLKLASAQSRWAYRQVQMGNCRSCGKTRNKYKQLCDTCQSKVTAYMRRWRSNRKAKETPNAPPPTQAA